MPKMTASQLQDKLEDAHYQEGLRLFGKKRWELANIGWGSTDDSIASKVYGEDPKVLTSCITQSGKVTHEVKDYR